VLLPMACACCGKAVHSRHSEADIVVWNRSQQHGVRGLAGCTGMPQPHFICLICLAAKAASLDTWLMQSPDVHMSISMLTARSIQYRAAHPQQPRLALRQPRSALCKGAAPARPPPAPPPARPETPCSAPPDEPAARQRQPLPRRRAAPPQSPAPRAPRPRRPHRAPAAPPPGPRPPLPACPDAAGVSTTRRQATVSCGGSSSCQQATGSCCHMRRRLVARSLPRPRATRRRPPPPRRLRPPGQRRRQRRSAQPQQTAPPRALRTTPAQHAFVALRFCCRAACPQRDHPAGAAQSGSCCLTSQSRALFWFAAAQTMSRATQILRTYPHMLDPLSTCCHAPGGRALALFSSGLRADRSAAERRHSALTDVSIPRASHNTADSCMQPLFKAPLSCSACIRVFLGDRSSNVDARLCAQSFRIVALRAYGHLESSLPSRRLLALRPHAPKPRLPLRVPCVGRRGGARVRVPRLCAHTRDCLHSQACLQIRSAAKQPGCAPQASWLSLKT